MTVTKLHITVKIEIFVISMLLRKWGLIVYGLFACRLDLYWLVSDGMRLVIGIISENGSDFGVMHYDYGGMVGGSMGLLKVNYLGFLLCYHHG